MGSTRVRSGYCYVCTKNSDDGMAIGENGCARAGLGSESTFFYRNNDDIALGSIATASMGAIIVGGTDAMAIGNNSFGAANDGDYFIGDSTGLAVGGNTAARNGFRSRNTDYVGGG